MSALKLFSSIFLALLAAAAVLALVAELGRLDLANDIAAKTGAWK